MLSSVSDFKLYICQLQAVAVTEVFLYNSQPIIMPSKINLTRKMSRILTLLAVGIWGENIILI